MGKTPNEKMPSSDTTDNVAKKEIEKTPSNEFPKENKIASPKADELAEKQKAVETSKAPNEKMPSSVTTDNVAKKESPSKNDQKDVVKEKASNEVFKDKTPKPV